MNKISKETRNELVQALRERYAGSTKLEKARILDEFTVLSGFHRKLVAAARPPARIHGENPPSVAAA